MREPPWKAATKDDVDEMEKTCRAWWASEDMEPPDFGTGDIMALVLRLRKLEKHFGAKTVYRV